MYAVSFSEDKASHFGVPAGSLVPKVHTGFQHGFHRYIAHVFSCKRPPKLGKGLPRQRLASGVVGTGFDLRTFSLSRSNTPYANYTINKQKPHSPCGKRGFCCALQKVKNVRSPAPWRGTSRFRQCLKCRFANRKFVWHSLQNQIASRSYFRPGCKNQFAHR